MSCEILLTSRTDATIHLTNVTTGVSTSFMQSAPGNTMADGMCAEWIVELPPHVDGVPDLHFGRYGTVYLSDCFAGTHSDAMLLPGAGELLSLTNGFSGPLSTPTKLGDKALKVDFETGGSG